ncbi:MAG: hypothetical protein OQK04_19720 [Kangiellaceae bacterium]|nr:hypothetical protein [Kangiellaceae bacterium]MCW9000950.1 hypothetical protein [Kangiellaceae bacterium]
MPIRRKKIIAIVTLLLIVGFLYYLGPVIAPFLFSLTPSDKASQLGRPIPVKIESLKENEPTGVLWRAKPILIIEMTESLRNDFKNLDDLVCSQNHEFMPGQYLVMEQISSYLGCHVQLSPNLIELSESNWVAGFIDPCYGIKYDYFGRPLRSNYLPNGKQACELTRLKLVPHSITEKEIIVGL